MVNLWAYFTENKSAIHRVDNSPLFRLIRDAGLVEANIFIDDIRDSTRPELVKLFGVMAPGDTIMVRSLSDLSDTPDDLVRTLQALEDKGVEVASVTEPWFDYKSNFNIVCSLVSIAAEQAEKKRRLGMERAKAQGRMGRKPDQGKLGQVQKLRQAGLTVREITNLCGISRSTFYRHMGRTKE